MATLLRILVIILLSPILVPVSLYLRWRRRHERPPQLPAPDAEGRTRPFADVGIALDLRAWPAQPSRPGQPFAFARDSVSTVQLSKMNLEGAPPPDAMLEVAALGIADNVGKSFDTVLERPAAFASSHGVKGATVRGTKAPFNCQVWVLAAPSGCLWVTWTSTTHDASAAEALAKSAAHVDAARPGA